MLLSSFLFTLHFATINTYISEIPLHEYNPFTLHFATINTIKNSPFDFRITEFTLHFATINTVIHFTQYL